MMFMLMIVVTVPVVLAGDDPNEPTEFRMLADDEGDSGEPME